MGHDLLARARDQYAGLGCDGVGRPAGLGLPHVAARTRTKQELRTLAPGDRRAARATVTTGKLDRLGVLSASQALSSETSLDRLHARVVAVLGSMTGATAVHLVLWSDDRQDGFNPSPAAAWGSRAAVRDRGPAVGAALRRAHRDPLLVADATADERFARDPYLADADCCSLLAAPIFSRGTCGALLLLENRLLRGAFTADRLDAVGCIARPARSTADAYLRPAPGGPTPSWTGW